MKFIRELRMGPPKSFKTGAIVGTYPKPMFVSQFDRNGLDIIPSVRPNPLRAGDIAMDIVYSDIKFIKPDELVTYCKKKPEELPKVTCVDFSVLNISQMTQDFSPFADSTAYQVFVNLTNFLATIGCPWKTYCMDSITSLVDAMMSSVAKTNSKLLEDGRKWSPAVGGKVLQHVAVCCNLPLHVVFIAHSNTKENEITSDVSTIPLGPDKLSKQIGSLVSQYLYATTESGKAEVWTRAKGHVKAIGCRWPNDLKDICPADFKSIYGREV